MRVTQRYNKSSFSDKLLTLKEKRTKARVSLNSARWPGGGWEGWESASDSDVGREESKSDKHTFHKRCILISPFLITNTGDDWTEVERRKKKKRC